MSAGNRRNQRGPCRHLCAACRERRARFRYRGEVRADRQHVLCFQCFRAERDRLRARQVRDGNVTETPGGRWRGRKTSTTAGVSLTELQLEHRRAMLAHLAGQAAPAG